jgi:hypothetical protein
MAQAMTAMKAVSAEQLKASPVPQIEASCDEKLLSRISRDEDDEVFRMS